MTKTVELTVEDSLENFDASSWQVVEKSKHRIKIELDQSKDSIQHLLNYALRNFTLTDINIFEPPMEEIISAIYKERAT